MYAKCYNKLRCCILTHFHQNAFLNECVSKEQCLITQYWHFHRLMTPAVSCHWLLVLCSLRHLVYCIFDLLLEFLVPEIPEENFQRSLLQTLCKNPEKLLAWGDACKPTFHHLSLSHTTPSSVTAGLLLISCSALRVWVGDFGQVASLSARLFRVTKICV